MRRRPGRARAWPHRGGFANTANVHVHLARPLVADRRRVYRAWLLLWALSCFTLPLFQDLQAAHGTTSLKWRSRWRAHLGSLPPILSPPGARVVQIPDEITASISTFRPDQRLIQVWAARFSPGCYFIVGAARSFYFRPGHETTRIYHHPRPAIANAVRWRRQVGPINFGHRPATGRYREQLTPAVPANAGRKHLSSWHVATCR